MPDLWFNSVACPAVFVDGILCLHPVYKCETKRAFFSFRFPIGRPEFLGYSAWFHVLRAKEDVTVELLRRGACRPLSATGSYLNAISLLDPSHVLIRTKYEEQQLFGRAGGARGEDVFNPPAPKRQKSSELGASWRPHRRIGREQEEKDLEHAIHESLITAAQWREKTRQEPKDELECIGRVSLEAIEDRPGPSGFQPSASAAQSKMDEKDEKEGEDQQE
ncbi:hypothetical protein M3Y99_00817500 [Aphelenchoides fujianensis]|nr:hypothetical protein M3Y99_00817500 [Aphelenchoides fujianensis]